jgi:hypothetical protein
MQGNRTSYIIPATLLTWLALWANVLAASPRQVFSLDGVWQIEQGQMDAAPKQFTHEVAVPGLVDMAKPALGGQGEAFWYRRTFRVDVVPAVALLKIHKATYGTRVILNGELLGDHLPCFTPGQFDAKPALHVGENELLVRVGAAPNCLPKHIPWGFDNEKKRYIPGIFDSVELILTGAPHILRVQAVPDIAKKAVTVHAWLRDKTAAPSKLHFTVHETSTGKVVAEADCGIPAGDGPERTGHATLALQNCRLWSPEDPFLYELEAKGEADVLKTRFGMRSFRLDQATGRAILNGKPYFMRGSNVTLYRFFEDAQRGDKPWREEWVRRLHKAYRDMHWNSLRYCIGFPPETWYRIADEEGFLIQDEFPIWDMAGGPFQGDELAQEYTEWMQERWNHPCVVIWDACNETPSPETGKAIRKVRGLDFSGRPWDNGWSPPVAPGDAFEAHAYHWRDKEFRLKYMGVMPGVPSGSKFKDTGKHAIILNEYGWLWLNRDGSPTTLTGNVYNANLAPGASTEQRFNTYARVLAAETEFWRSRRGVAAVLEFCALGYSRPDGQTSDHWTDVEKLAWEPHFYKYVRDSFAPVGLMIDAWAPSYPPGSNQDFPVIAINDLYQDWQGTVQFRVLRDGKAVVEKSEPCIVPALGKKAVAFSIDIPKELGKYRVEAVLVKPGADPVRSLRDFDVAPGK